LNRPGKIQRFKKRLTGPGRSSSAAKLCEKLETENGALKTGPTGLKETKGKNRKVKKGMTRSWKDPVLQETDIQGPEVPHLLHNPHIVQLIKPFKVIQVDLERGESIVGRCLHGMAIYYLMANGCLNAFITSSM
jgi:hypothetical protein